MVDIAEVLTNGIAFDPKRWRESSPNGVENVPGAVARLFDRLTELGISATLVGDIALLNYLAGRNTQILEFIMAFDDARAIDGLVVRERTGCFALAEFESLRIELLLPECALYRIVQEQYTQPIQYRARTIFTATVEGLMLLRLFALPALYRQMQTIKAASYEADLFALMVEYLPDTSPLLDLVSAHVLPSDAEELRKIVAEIEGKLGRRRFGG